MNKLPGISSPNKAPRSLVLFFILISSISSVSLTGWFISPQEVWANHAAPVLEDPANGACTGDNTPNLNWANSASSGVLNYKVEVDQDSIFTAPIFYSPATAPTSSNLNNAGPAGGFPDGTYFWHVATQGTGTGHALGPFSSTFSFIVDTQAPAAPTGGLPSLTNDQTPLLTWN